MSAVLEIMCVEISIPNGSSLNDILRTIRMFADLIPPSYSISYAISESTLYLNAFSRGR